MKKNVIWWPAVVNESHIDKYGGYNYFQYSKKTWEYWCERNGCLFVPFGKKHFLSLMNLIREI